MTIKAIFLFSAAAFLLLLTTCSDENIFGNSVVNTNFIQTETFSFNSEISGQSKLVVNAVNGTIQIGLSDDSEIYISGTKKVASESEQDAAAYLDKLRVIYEPSGDEIFLSTQQPADNNGRNLSVDYYIQVPDSFAVDINELNGEVTLDNIQGDAHIELLNGKLELNNIAGSLEAKINNGNAIGSLNLPIGGACLIEIINGTIDLDIPAVTSASFQAAITNGTISVNNLAMQNTVSSQNLVSGTLNAGQGHIGLKVVNGIIQVNGF